jgi:hypothetical protein
MKSVRVGRQYRVARRTPMWPGPAVGTVVEVVNLPAGSRGGCLRNVVDCWGMIHFVHISTLERI